MAPSITRGDGFSSFPSRPASWRRYFVHNENGNGIGHYRNYKSLSNPKEDAFLAGFKSWSYGDISENAEPCSFNYQRHKSTSSRSSDEDSADEIFEETEEVLYGKHHRDRSIECQGGHNKEAIDKSADSVFESLAVAREPVVIPSAELLQWHFEVPVRHAREEPPIQEHNFPSEKPKPTSHGYPFVPAIPQPNQFYANSNESSSVFSGVSAPSRAIRHRMRNFPLTQPFSDSQSNDSSMPAARPDLASHLSGYYHHAGNNSKAQYDGTESRQIVKRHFSPSPDRSPALSAQWSDLYEQRSRMARYRKQMVESVGQLKAFRLEKTKADNAFRRLALLYSESSKPLPPQRSARLLEEIQKLEDDCVSVESRIEQLGETMGRHEAKLESSEIALYQHMSTGSRPSLSVDLHFGLHDKQNFSQDKSDKVNRNPVVHAASPVVSAYTPVGLLLLGISGDRPSDKHPIYNLLLESIKDLNVAKDRHRRLLQERDDILRYRKIRAERGSPFIGAEQDFDLKDVESAMDAEGLQLGWSPSAYSAFLDKVDLDFLQHFEESLGSVEAVVHQQEKYVQKLRDTCFGKSIFPKGMSLEDEQYILGEENVPQLPDIALDALRLGVEVRASDVSSFPILLSNPLFAVKQYPLTAREVVNKMLALPENDPQRQALIDDSVKEYGILSSLMRSVTGSKSDFINRWLLQQLRMSPMDALLLYATFTGILSVLNLDRWQQDVLHFWARDGTNLPDYFLHGPVTPLATTISYHSSMPPENSSNSSASFVSFSAHGGSDA